MMTQMKMRMIQNIKMMKLMKMKIINKYVMKKIYPMAYLFTTITK